MTYKQLTANQRNKAIEAAREAHDTRYQVDHPEPSLDTSQELTTLEKAAGYLWVIWGILGLAGAIISAPHTLKAILPTVDLTGALQWGYALAGFIGVELALIGIALVSELQKAEQGRHEPEKQASLAGVVNGLFVRLGFRPPLDTSHLPDKTPGSGLGLVFVLFLASLSFNLADTLSDVPMLQVYGEQILLASRVMVGILGPGLLLIAGHRFAHEVVRAASGRRSKEGQHKEALATWEAGLQASWASHSEEWLQAELHKAWLKRNPGAPAEDSPYWAGQEEESMGFLPSVNGHKNEQQPMPTS